jgi:3-dehydroquinate synthase
LQAYGLPTFLKFEADRVLEVLKMDKKRAGQQMNFILLDRIGKARIQPISLDLLAERVNQLSSR